MLEKYKKLRPFLFLIIVVMLCGCIGSVIPVEIDVDKTQTIEEGQLWVIVLETKKAIKLNVNLNVISGNGMNEYKQDMREFVEGWI